jgi:hypothetical protein
VSHRQVVGRHPHQRAKPKARTIEASPLRRADPRPNRQGLVSAVVPAETAQAVHWPRALQFVLGFALALVLLVVGVAAAPPWALPRPVFDQVDGRREPLIFSAFTVLALALGVGVVIMVAAS